MKIITIANQKGGVGKTTTTVNIAVALHRKGKKVLCIDLDPQANLGMYLGHIPDDKPTITDLLFNKATYRPLPVAAEMIRHAGCGVDFIPASLALSKADMVLAQALFRERLLADALAESIPADAYDYAIIDCNPSMGILVTNALVAANAVLIPVQTESFALEGLEDMMSLIGQIRSQTNPTLQVAGLLPTMVSKNGESREALETMRRQYGSICTATQISRRVAAARSARSRKPLSGGKSELGQQYEAAAEELLARMEG